MYTPYTYMYSGFEPHLFDVAYVKCMMLIFLLLIRGLNFETRLPYMERDIFNVVLCRNFGIKINVNTLWEH